MRSWSTQNWVSVSDHGSWTACGYELHSVGLQTMKIVWSYLLLTNMIWHLTVAPVNTTTQWREDWSSLASVVVNHSIVANPTIWQPGFDLPRHTWSLLNHFQTDQGPCCANLRVKWHPLNFSEWSGNYQRALVLLPSENYEYSIVSHHL